MHRFSSFAFCLLCCVVRLVAETKWVVHCMDYPTPCLLHGFPKLFSRQNLSLFVFIYSFGVEGVPFQHFTLNFVQRWFYISSVQSGIRVLRKGHRGSTLSQILSHCCLWSHPSVGLAGVISRKCGERFHWLLKRGGFWGELICMEVWFRCK